jgi:hypothetical protein
MASISKEARSRNQVPEDCGCQGVRGALVEIGLGELLSNS